jgi:ferredoxin/flavodoxin---NADP+ reductase
MKILNKNILADDNGLRIIRMDILAPEVALKVKAGQFVMLIPTAKGERIPLTVVNSDKQSGSITLIFQETGFTTKILGAMQVGDILYALAGPLGHATEVNNLGKVILVGGGVGIAEIYPVACAMRKAGNHITAILGAKNKNLLILEPELKNISQDYYCMTDDGSGGEKGFTTDKLSALLSKDKYDLVYAVGPIPMMKKVAQITHDLSIKSIVSLNALMVDATGMCGCCRVTVAGKVKFSCIDGPEFSGSDIDWNELEKRNRMYINSEKHICKLMG